MSLQDYDLEGVAPDTLHEKGKVQVFQVKGKARIKFMNRNLIAEGHDVLRWNTVTVSRSRIVLGSLELPFTGASENRSISSVRGNNTVKGVVTLVGNGLEKRIGKDANVTFPLSLRHAHVKNGDATSVFNKCQISGAGGTMLEAFYQVVPEAHKFCTLMACPKYFFSAEPQWNCCTET
ncbi:hypothetical protein BC830DRAFT_1081112 [Chytriomyces sp. MP71]|nr:hypothetical protein BC830DRAFT_1081112 [Chytriomyces sp. MP71]